jgi:hypothetical protein
MGFSFIVTSIVLVICSSYRIHISLRAHCDGASKWGLSFLDPRRPGAPP